MSTEILITYVVNELNGMLESWNPVNSYKTPEKYDLQVLHLVDSLLCHSLLVTISSQKIIQYH